MAHNISFIAYKGLCTNDVFQKVTVIETSFSGTKHEGNKNSLFYYILPNKV